MRGGDVTNCIVIDLDLHNGSKKVFLRQLRVIMDHFHGSRKCHYSVSRSGVHVIIMLDRPTRIESARAWLRKELESLDTEELKAMALKHNMRPLSDVEIKPSQKDGWRLPFARGRVTYLDEPLEGNDARRPLSDTSSGFTEPTLSSMKGIFSSFPIILVTEEQKPPQEKSKFVVKRKVKIKMSARWAK